jgi:hypothetical protein
MGALSMQAELPSTLPGAMWLPGVCLAFGGRGAGAQAFPSVVLRGAPASWPRRYSWWGAELLSGTYEVQVVDTLSPCDPFMRRGTQEG